MRTASLLILTVVFALVLSGAASAGTPLTVNQTGTVSGDLYVNTTNPWASSTQGATNEVTQANTLPTYTSIDSAMVYVNVYSGSGTNNWPVRTTVKLDGNGDGDYDDAGELLGVEDMNIPGTTDGTVYWLNDHCNRVYSDYQVWYDVKNLITSTNPTLYVKTETMGGDGYDGRIKLLALCVAYNDGDSDKVDYWVLNGQDWINADTSPSTSTFNTSSISGQASSATLNTVALSGTDGTYTFNGNTKTGNITETGAYYKENSWDVTSDINAGANSTLTYANVGSSLKVNLAILTIREAAPVAPMANFTADNTTILRKSAVQFTSNSTGTITSYAWDFDNDGTTDSTLQNPTYTYNTPGTYTVNLTVTGPAGTDTKTITDYITVNPKIWYVDDNGGTGIDYTNIQDAINNASSYDTIYVYAGTYDGFLVNIPHLSIIGESADTVTVGQIYLPEGSRASDNANEAVLQGLKTTSPPQINKASLASGNYIIIKDCIFEGITTTVVDSTTYHLTFESNVIKNCTGSIALLIKGSSWIITNNTIKNNSNAAAIAMTTTNNIITNNHIESNKYAFRFANTPSGNVMYLNDLVNNTQITMVSGTVPTVSWSSPNMITYIYNGTTYTGYMGNYWSNYAGVDANGDGIGDTPYTVPNGLGTDNYPLIAPLSQYSFPGVDTEAPTVTATPTGGDVISPTQVTLSAIDNQDTNPTIYYTTNGRTPSIYSGTKYTSPITITKTTTLKFIAIDVSDNSSAVQSETYTDAQAPTATANLTVTINPNGTPSTLMEVTLSATDNLDPNPKIYYTLDGSDPTTSSTLCTDPIIIPATTTVKFIAVDIGGNISPVQSETYTINDTQTPTVTTNPTSETFNPPIQVTLSAIDNVDPNPIIYYTVDGTDPTTSSTLYTGPLTFTVTTTLKFIGVDASGNSSAVQSETYTMVDTEAPNVTATQSGTTVTLSATDNSGIEPTIYYTTDGTDPTTSTPYNGPITIPQYATTVVKFIAVDASGNTSPVQSRTFTTYTGEDKNGGRYYNGTDLETKYYVEGNVGLVISNGGTKYGWFAHFPEGGTGTVTYTSSSLNIPAGATILAARLYQAWTWYGYPGYTLLFNGQNMTPIARYEDATDGQNVYDVTPYFNATGDNTAVITSSPAANYATILIVVYQSASEPYRQIWIDEGYDVLYYAPADGYAMFNNITKNKVVSAQIITILPSGDTILPSGEFEDGQSILLNGQNMSVTGGGGSDPSYHYFNVTTALKNGTNEMGTWGRSYFALQNAILTLTLDTTAPSVTASIGTGVFGSSQNVALTATDNVDTSPDIYYTLDGSTPTSSSTLYTGLISIDVTTVLRFFAVDDAGNASSVESRTYTIDSAASTVTATPAGGLYNTNLNVVLKAEDNIDAHPSIYYTTNGETPTISGTLYTEPVLISSTSILRFIAVDLFGNTSPVGSETYTIDKEAPTATANPACGIYNTAQTVILAASDNLDISPEIRYTTDGSTPTASSTLYGGPISIGSSATLKFIALDDAGNTSTVQSETYNIEPVPVAQFTATPTTGTTPLQVQFTNQSTGTVTNYAWDFDNNGTTDSIIENPTYNYNTPGTYTVKLTVTGPGGSDDEIKTNYITVNEPAPVAQFVGTPTTGTTPLQVAFTNQSTGTVTSYAWDFDNNGIVDSTDTNPVWTYNTAGTYTVKLTATGPGGSDDETKTDYITVNQPAPVADFAVVSTSGTSPLTVAFTNQSTNATEWAWDFNNDGTVDSTDQNPTWIYDHPGTYTVKLNVTGPGGIDEETKTDYITVNKSTQSDLLATEMKVTNNSYLNYSLVDVIITNIGLKTAGYFDVTLYDNGTQVGQQYALWLASDAVRTVSFIWSPATIGEHNLIAVIDQNNSIEESNEYNNQITQLVDNRPDLTPTEIKANTLPFNYCYVTVDVTNNGEDLTEFYDITLYDNGTQIGQQKVYGLRTGETKTITFLSKLTSSSTHNLQVTTDATTTIPETNETNNTITKQI